MNRIDPHEAPTGWYWLVNEAEVAPSAVRLYDNEDAGTRGLGFNICDGGGFIPLTDLKPDSFLFEMQLPDLKPLEQDPPPFGFKVCLPITSGTKCILVGYEPNKQIGLISVAGLINSEDSPQIGAFVGQVLENDAGIITINLTAAGHQLSIDIDRNTGVTTVESDDVFAGCSIELCVEIL
jgi:hypothetical protein